MMQNCHNLAILPGEVEEDTKWADGPSPDDFESLSLDTFMTMENSNGSMDPIVLDIDIQVCVDAMQQEEGALDVHTSSTQSTSSLSKAETGTSYPNGFDSTGSLSDVGANPAPAANTNRHDDPNVTTPKTRHAPSATPLARMLQSSRYDMLTLQFLWANCTSIM